MAFLATSPEAEAARENRFSLLLLGHGDVYFEDYSVVYYPVGTPEHSVVQNAVRGRLKICAKSVLFDPQDVRQPILKFLLRDCKRIDHWPVPLISRIKGEVLVIETTHYAKIREDNLIKPYEFCVSKKALEFRFTPNYVTIATMLDKARALHSCAIERPRDLSTEVARVSNEHQAGIEFNIAWLEDLSEKILLKTKAERVTPLQSNPGRVMLTSSRIYFQPFNNVSSEPVTKYRISRVRRIVKRRHLLRDVGIELELRKPHILYLTFATTAERDTFYDLLVEQPKLKLEFDDRENMLLRWQNGELSNFDYLMYLNSMADRSFNDLTQYPVFPWVIADYTSQTLDLQNPDTFRDLSKPIGALTEDRLATFKERFREMPEPKFLYGTHYSTPGYVLFYTIRVAPEYSLCLQNGKFDHADRLFTSVAETWTNVRTGAADVKELTPEFYLPDSSQFLVNSQALDLGATQDGVKVGDVELPPWADDAKDFVSKCRAALECPYVSERIHHWIDLIFGFKQRGQAAIDSDNLFYYLTYEGSVDLEKVTDPVERASYEAQITEFGQTPKQLFTLPHPARRRASEASGPPCIQDPLFNKGAEWRPPQDPDGAVSTVPAKAAASKAPAEDAWSGLLHLAHSSTHKLHRDSVTAIRLSSDGENIYTVAQDSYLKVFSIPELRQVHSVTLGDLALSSIAIQSEGQNVIVSSWDNSIYFYSIEYGRITDTWPAHYDAVSQLQLHGDTLISGSWDSTVKVWDVAPSSGRSDVCITELAEHEGEVKCLDVFEQTIASGSADGTVIFWDLESLASKFSMEAHSDAVNDLAFSTDGKRLASCGADRAAKVFDAHSGSVLWQTPLDHAMLCLAFNGTLIVGGDDAGAVQLWDVVASSHVLALSQHKAAVRCIAVSRDGSTVVSGSDDKSVVIWKTTG